MNFTIVISNEAEADLDEAFLWYEFQSIGLGGRLALFVDKGFDTIASMPMSFTPVVEDVRKFVMGKFPYNIYFRLDIKKSKIEIIRILHHKQEQKLY